MSATYAKHLLFDTAFSFSKLNENDVVYWYHLTWSLISSLTSTSTNPWQIPLPPQQYITGQKRERPGNIYWISKQNSPAQRQMPPRLKQTVSLHLIFCIWLMLPNPGNHFLSYVGLTNNYEVHGTIHSTKYLNKLLQDQDHILCNSSGQALLYGQYSANNTSTKTQANLLLIYIYIYAFKKR